MSMSAILIAALVMSVLGLIFGALLGVTGRVFKVPVNEKAEALRECLPGANCGACGFPGCDGYAAAGCRWQGRGRRLRRGRSCVCGKNGQNHGCFGQCFRPYGGVRGLPGLWPITASRRLTIRA